MSLVLLVLGHLNVLKEGLMHEICVCCIHLLLFVKQLISNACVFSQVHLSNQEKKHNFCEFY